MSNIILRSPIIVDTASATAITSYTFIANKIRWVGATTAGHTVVVQNGSTHVKWTAEATGANYTEETHFSERYPLILDGLIVPTLASGILYIYISSQVPIKT